MGWMDGFGHMTGWGWFWMFLAWIFWAVLMGLILVSITRMVRGPGSFRSSMPREDEALEILRSRYARGEIDKQEYEERLRDLTR